MSAKTSFFAELQRRHVYKVGAAYAVGGWLAVQVVTQVFPIFGISAVVQRIIVLALIAGFPVALVLAWVFDLTPAGIVRTGELPTGGETTTAVRERRSIDRKLNYVLGTLLLLAIVHLVLDRLQAYPEASGRAATAPSPTPADRSIAVLPFTNLSPDPGNAFFAVGIQDEILTRLARIGALKVISRTSTQQIASSPDNLPQIAKQLGVAHVLEGSVQRAGNAVHVNVQLIRAATDEHLWAESYDRKLDDIFAVEGEVAGMIAEQLDAKLSGAEQKVLNERPTRNSAAYDAYLRGRALSSDSNSIDPWRRAVAEFAEAAKLDPSFAQAWAYRGIAESFLYLNGIAPDVITGESIHRAVEMARRLQPDAGEVLLAQGYELYRVQADFPAAQREFEAALQCMPNDATSLAALGFVERRQGAWDAALGHLRHAAELDPRHVGLFTAIGGELLLNIQRWDEANAWLDRALAIEPNDASAIAYKTIIAQQQGKLEDAARLLESIPLRRQDPIIAAGRGYQRLLEHRYDVAIAELQPVVANAADPALDGWGPQLVIDLGLAQLRAGQSVAAKQTFDRAIDLIGPGGATRVTDDLLPILLALAYAGAGDTKAALEQARRGAALFANDALHAAQGRETIAIVQAWAGDRDAAMQTLAAVQPMPSKSTAALLRLDPVWDPLRADPRFQQLVSEIQTREITSGSSPGT